MLGEKIYYRLDDATVRPGVVVAYFPNGFGTGIDRFNVVVFLDGANDGVTPPDAPIIWKSSVKMGIGVGEIMPFAVSVKPSESNTVILPTVVVPAPQPSVAPGWFSPVWCGDTGTGPH